MITIRCLFVQLVTLFEPFNPSSRINHLSFAGKEGMALAAKLNSELLLGGTNRKSISAGANYLRILKKFGVNLIFHFFILQRKR
jgi:hypothetical protein